MTSEGRHKLDFVRLSNVIIIMYVPICTCRLDDSDGVAGDDVFVGCMHKLRALADAAASERDDKAVLHAQFHPFYAATSEVRHSTMAVLSPFPFRILSHIPIGGLDQAMSTFTYNKRF